jgi:hypothetical protein
MVGRRAFQQQMQECGEDFELRQDTSSRQDDEETSAPLLLKGQKQYVTAPEAMQECRVVSHETSEYKTFPSELIGS